MPETGFQGEMGFGQPHTGTHGSIEDAETTDQPSTVATGREPPVGSRGETGQKPMEDLQAAVPIEGSEAGIQWECMSCGKVHDEPFATCPACGGSVRKVGPLGGEPVFAMHKEPAKHDPPITSAETPGTAPGMPYVEGDNRGHGPSPAGLRGDRSGDSGINAYESATIEDLSARGEGDSFIPQPEGGGEQSNSPRVDKGGDHRPQGERPHESDMGIAGGGGGAGAT
ncbi:MAG: hypothetical protein ACRDIA_05840 [Actinomycetota bacterium]